MRDGVRALASGVYLETKYPGVYIGAVASGGSLLLVDCPIRVEDGREWLTGLAEHGRPRYLVLLDHHPDRVLGARGLDLPIVAHDETRRVMGGWPDTYKGGAHPIGAEADRLKRITGVGKAVPDLTFSSEMQLYMGKRLVRLLHRPGPTAGAIWVVVEELKVAFIGDAVSRDEPPYLGDADIASWLDSLNDLGKSAWRGFTLVSARDGVIERKDVSAMAAWLEKLPARLRKWGERGEPTEAAAGLAGPLMRSFRVPATRREQALLRLQAGLTRLAARQGPSEA
jgi:glyoxylase-like metal-dependent hydrolase (beta-lactamase superfamily II)